MSQTRKLYVMVNEAGTRLGEPTTSLKEAESKASEFGNIFKMDSFKVVEVTEVQKGTKAFLPAPEGGGFLPSTTDEGWQTDRSTV